MHCGALFVSQRGNHSAVAASSQQDGVGVSQSELNGAVEAAQLGSVGMHAAAHGHVNAVQACGCQQISSEFIGITRADSIAGCLSRASRPVPCLAGGITKANRHTTR